jgi:hypothetical protein
LVYVFISP